MTLFPSLLRLAKDFNGPPTCHESECEKYPPLADILDIEL